MSDPARQLRAVGEANQAVQGVAGQALEWVRLSEQRVKDAEARADGVRDQLKDRAMETLRKVSEEAKSRIAAEREGREEAEAKDPGGVGALYRAATAVYQLKLRTEQEREEAFARAAGAQEEADKAVAEAVEHLRVEADRREREAREVAQAEADRRVAAAEQRAAEAEAAAAEAHETAVRLETEIERRVMEGTEDVRREAEESIRTLVEKVEEEATQSARSRAEEQLRVESDRIRVQAEKREERARQATEDEIKASANKAKREVLAAAEENSPTWLRSDSGASTAGYRTF